MLWGLSALSRARRFRLTPARLTAIVRNGSSDGLLTVPSMLNWLKVQTARRAAGEQSPGRAMDDPYEEAMAACPPQPSSHLMSAIRNTASALGTEVWRGPIRRHRGRIIVILARQLADANQRLSSSYWTGADGHNVGEDVFQAYGIALGVVRRARSLEELIAALIAASAAYRSRPGDPDGYGSATLGEIERDLKVLSDQIA